MSDDVTTDPMVKSPEGKDRSAQPDLINLKQIPTSTAQEVETDVLRPVVFSSDNSFCRFELEPKGFLSPTSSISLGVKSSAGVNRAQFPINIGVHSLIQRAVLKTSSGRVISDMDDFSYFDTLKSNFIDNTTQQERDQYICGRCVNWEPFYTKASATTDNLEFNTEAQRMVLGNGKEYGGEKVASNGDYSEGLTPRNFTIVSADANRTGLTPTFSVRIYELFPFLKSGNQLPLFMMGSDRVQIELYFTNIETTDRMVLSKEDEGQTGAEFSIDQNTCEFISDHIFYPGQMEDWASRNKNLTFQYFDYVVNRQLITSNADKDLDNANHITRQIGGAGRIVTRAYAGFRPNVVAGKDDRAIFNRYQAEGLFKIGAYQDTGELCSNLFYNEKYLFPHNVMNGARHYHNLRDAEKKQLYVPREVYSNGGNLLPVTADGDDFHYDGRTQDQMKASQFWQGWRLNHGERVGSKGIEVTMNTWSPDYSRSGLQNGTYILTSWTEQLRYATMKDGQLEVFWS